MLYRDFKPDCCLWEIYGMLQKATLVGLLEEDMIDLVGSARRASSEKLNEVPGT